MRLYTVQTGDTAESIAQSFLLQTSRAGEILEKNNVSQVFPGLTIKIPRLFPVDDSPPDFQAGGIIVDGVEILSVPGITVVLAYDAIAGTFDFALPNDPIFRDITKPYGYQDVKIFFKDTRLMTGTLLNPSPKTEAIICSGKSRPGIISAVNIPPSSYPRTFYKTSFKTIVEKYCGLFEIEVDIDSDAKEAANLKFEKTAISPDEYLSTYLTSLAQQRGLLISSSPEGKLRISKSIQEGPVLDIVSPVNATITFDADSIYSDYTVLRAGNSVRKAAEANSKLDLNVFRSNVIQQTDRTAESAKDYLQGEIIKSLINSFSLDISLPYIYNADKKIIQPGQIITVDAPELQIKRPTDFTVRTSRINLKPTSESCTVDLVPTEWLKGNFIKFWE